MDSRVLILTLPSLAVLGLLIAHSLRAMTRGRAAAFWCTVVLYGIARGVALKWVIDHGGGTSFPYTIRSPLFSILGVSLQEIAGWAIVTYLGWWLATRVTPLLFSQIAWACLFLGAISWAVESAAVAAGWWSWTVPVTNPLFGNVPFIAIVDWLFVGIDFLLPFVVITAPALSARPARFVALLAFPAHFGAHVFSGRTLGVLPIPIHHAAHWILIAVVLWLVLRSDAKDEPFGSENSWMPLSGLSIVLLVAAAVELGIVKEPKLLRSILPVCAVTLASIHPAGRRATAGFLAWTRRRRAWLPIAVVGMVFALAYQAHSAGARKQADLTRRLDEALAARDRGDLDAAERSLAALAADFPGSHVPSALLGEIAYRTEHLEQAREAFAHAVEIKQDYAKGFRYLAVIDLRLGRKDRASQAASRGLTLAPADPELFYLLERAHDRGDIAHRMNPRDSETTFTLASLAFEVGDKDGAAALLDHGLDRWPEQRMFHAGRVKLALAGGDRVTARRIVSAWIARFPQDAEARQLSRVLERD